MDTKRPNIQNKTADFFYKISYLSFFFGMPNFWVEDLPMSKTFMRSYRFISKLCNLLFVVFVPFELGAIVTQNNLTTKQDTDMWIYCIAHPFLLVYVVIMERKEKDIREWITRVLEMQEVYNDPKVETQMVRKSSLTSSLMMLSIIVSMLLNSAGACMQVIKYDGTFTTIITVWPPVDQHSAAADSVRIITNLVWWLFIFRVSSCYVFVISLITCVSFQYENLQSYFYSLNKIFEEDLPQSEMERKYEDRLKTGIKLHSNTFECVDRVKEMCGGVLSSQIVYIVIILVFLMSQMLRSERTIVNAFATALTATAVLMTTGLFMWNAGDITIEKPVVLKGFDMIDLSYQSFLYLVKTSYSVFSVLY